MPVTAQLSDAKRTLLAKYVAGKARNAVSGSNTIVRRDERTTAPLSLSQEELWKRELRVPEIPPLYNECVTIHMNGQLDVTALEWALTEIVRRHEIWRTRFETDCGRPVQTCQQAQPVDLPIVNLSNFPEAERDQQALRIINAECKRPFDVQHQPPLRPILLRISETEHRLYLIAHQIVLDGVSAYQIFPSELAELYRAFLEDRPPNLPELSIQCADFACWQRQWIEQVRDKQLAYWRQQLGVNSPAQNWPGGAPRHAQRTYRGVIRPFEFSAEVSRNIRAFSSRQNTTLFSTLLAGFAALLHRYTQHTDVIIGTLSPCGRKRIETIGLLGYFLNPVALRFNFEGNPAFDVLIRQAQRVMAEAICNDDVPIEELAREIKGEDSSPSQFFRAALSLQPSTPSLGLDWSVTSMDVESGGSPWELYIAFIDKPQGLIGRIQFDPGVFHDEAIERLLADLQDLLEAKCLTSVNN